MAAAHTRSAASSHMHGEAADAASALRRQWQRNAQALATLGAQLRALAPRAVITLARGSSDHAATYGKYLIETQARTLVSSCAPSVNSIYLARQDLHGCLLLAISQSGHSPDLLASAKAARAAGATVVALVNAEDSPLSHIAQVSVPLCAGIEQSVAATKSFIASLGALLHLVAAWTDDASLLAALEAAPGQLEQAWSLDWRPALRVLQPAAHLFVIGRGLGLGIAQEAALKCKETGGLHAEAFSSAEVAHGPQALLGPGFPALLLAQDDDTRPGVEQLARQLAARDVPLLLAGGQPPEGVIALPTIAAHAAVQPLLLAQSFYRLANELAFARGHDPDRPPHLAKVTRTL